MAFDATVRVCSVAVADRMVCIPVSSFWPSAIVPELSVAPPAPEVKMKCEEVVLIVAPETVMVWFASLTAVIVRAWAMVNGEATVPTSTGRPTYR